jgi:hypothetical protein
MVCSNYNITGVIEVSQCNTSATIIADIVLVEHDGGGEVEPEAWYLPSAHPWRFPILDKDRATLLARSKVEVRSGSHSVLDADTNYYKKRYKTVLWEWHRVFLVVHLLVGPSSQVTNIGLNISGYLNFYKRESEYYVH